MSDELPNVFQAASDFLRSSSGHQARYAAPVEQLLLRLGYDRNVAAAVPSRAELENRIALLATVSKFHEVFELAAPDAPGLTCFGGIFRPCDLVGEAWECSRTSATGMAFDAGSAFEACVGESLEYAAQFAVPRATIALDQFDSVSAGLSTTELEWLSSAAGISPGRHTGPLDCVRARRVNGCAEALIPLDLCYRRPNQEARTAIKIPRGAGCAAGPSFESALETAVLELIERDAAALWWIGGKPGCDISPELALVAERTLRELRGKRCERRTWQLDISTEIEVPCVAALSTNQDGRALACGLAAHILAETAMKRAIIEMCMMELGNRLWHARDAAARRSGANCELPRVTIKDNVVDAAKESLLHPVGCPAPSAANRNSGSAGDRGLHAKLSRDGFDCYAMELPVDFPGVSVVRAIMPGLQPLGADLVTSRLRKELELTGGGGPFRRGIALM